MHKMNASIGVVILNHHFAFSCAKSGGFPCFPGTSSRSRRTSAVLSHQEMSRAVQIGEATGDKKSMRVLRQALVADLRELEQLLDGEKRMLDRRSDWAGRLNECSIGRSFREYPGHK